LWKIELQKVANEFGVPITVCHLPAGTSPAARHQQVEQDRIQPVLIIGGNWRGKTGNGMP
jgi:hypothetical protein